MSLETPNPWMHWTRFGDPLRLGFLAATRDDWQSMMPRFRASEFSSLRAFVTLEYVKDAPLKIGAASVIGLVMGTIGGSLGRPSSNAS